MYLASIKLWNFRKFGGETFDIEKPNLELCFNKGLNVIIGANDAGKTGIMDAIKLVLKTHSYEYIRVDEKDFYGNSDRFRIELVFEDLTDDEAKNFTEWLSWNEANNTPYLKVIYDVKRTADRVLAADVKAGADDDATALSAEAREYLKITYLKPLRDAEFELVSKKNSRLSQILLGHSAFSKQENEHHLVKIFNENSSQLQKYFQGEYEPDASEQEKSEKEKGKKVKEQIDIFIKAFYGQNDEITFKTASHEIKDILEKLTLGLKNEQYPGLGTLNRLFMAAELLHLKKDNWSGLRLGLIEELEAHLHPQAQMQVIEALQKQEDIQLILTTHSPNLASKIKLENLIICNDNYAFPMGKEYTKLEEKDYIFLEKFLDVTKSNLFFAKGVILVEGWAEEILIPSIAKLIGVDLVAKGISIVNIGNVGFEHYCKIFLRENPPYMSIPVAVITDCDIAEYEKTPKLDTDGKPIKLDNKIQYEYKKLNIDDSTRSTQIKHKDKSVEEQNLKYFISSLWTLEYCLYTSKSLREIFVQACKDIHSDSDWDSNFEEELAKKLINKGLEKTKIPYKLTASIDNNISTIEEIEANDSIYYIVEAIKYAAGELEARETQSSESQNTLENESVHNN